MEPLASRLRPTKIEDFLGQVHILDPSKPFRRSLEQNHISSTIFWGPPGCGKTTLAVLTNIAIKYAQLSVVQERTVLKNV